MSEVKAGNFPLYTEYSISYYSEKLASGPKEADTSYIDSGEIKYISLLPTRIEKIKDTLARFVISGPSVVPPGYDCKITLDPFHENTHGGTIVISDSSDETE